MSGWHGAYKILESVLLKARHLSFCVSRILKSGGYDVIKRIGAQTTTW